MDFLRKVQTGEELEAGAGGDVLSVMIEPYPGHSDEEVISSLEALGVSDVTLLAPGYISARADASALKEVEGIAHVHQKARKQLR
jgi:hypothetical protein